MITQYKKSCAVTTQDIDFIIRICKENTHRERGILQYGDNYMLPIKLYQVNIMLKIGLSSMTSKLIIIHELEPVLNHTEKSSYYSQFSTNIKIKIVKLLPVLLDRAKIVLILQFSILISAGSCL